MKALRPLKKNENTKSDLRQRLAFMYSTRLAKYMIEYFDISLIYRHILVYPAVAIRAMLRLAID